MVFLAPVVVIIPATMEGTRNFARQLDIFWIYSTFTSYPDVVFYSCYSALYHTQPASSIESVGRLLLERNYAISYL